MKRFMRYIEWLINIQITYFQAAVFGSLISIIMRYNKDDILKFLLFKAYKLRHTKYILKLADGAPMRPLGQHVTVAYWLGAALRVSLSWPNSLHGKTPTRNIETQKKLHLESFIYCQYLFWYNAILLTCSREHHCRQ